MPWTLTIHTFDVGQGDSSFIVADNGAGLTRSMLIDGGESQYAEAVNQQLIAIGVPVDHVLTTHYHDDHVGGITALLIADNLSAVCTTIAATAVTAGAIGALPIDRIAGYAAATAAALKGGYGAALPVTANVVLTARAAVQATDTVAIAVNRGKAAARNALPVLASPPSFPFSATVTSKVVSAVATAIEAQVAAGVVAVPALQAAAYTAAWFVLSLTVPMNAQFDTGGRFAQSQIIDLGALDAPADYLVAVAGGWRAYGNNGIPSPLAPRPRTTPALGNEVLFNSGNGAAPPPANAPAAIVVAINQTSWPTGAQFAGTGEPDNDKSIGLVFQFGNFGFWTAGDLPTSGEDTVAAAVIGHSLPEPGGAGYPALTRFATFKAGHHGSETSTSPGFLALATPRSILISCGENANHEHPRQSLINRVYVAPSIGHMYLTNCNYERLGILATHGIDQLAPGVLPAIYCPPGVAPGSANRSRISGDNDRPNLTPGRVRGNIRTTITQAASVLAPGNPARQFLVQYWETDMGNNAMGAANPAAFRPETTTF